MDPQNVDDVMEWAFLILCAMFLLMIPASLLAVFILKDPDIYEVTLTTGMASFATALNYALIRVGRVSNYHPELYGARDEIYGEPTWVV